MFFKVFLMCLFFTKFIFAIDMYGLIEGINNKLKNPQSSLENLQILGNSNLKEASIILLPEIHDNAESLLNQLLIISLLKEQKKDLIILDESLKSLTKSPWELFSQKSLEIIAAIKQKNAQKSYDVEKFEQELQNLSRKFSQPGKYRLKVLNNNLLGFTLFKNIATPFYGWDDHAENSSMEKRNQVLINTLNKLSNSNKVIVVMLGSRHIPELDFYGSASLMCDPSTTIDEFFSSLRNKNKLQIGSTKNLYTYLQSNKYIVMFDKSLLTSMDATVEKYKNKLINCLD